MPTSATLTCITVILSKGNEFVLHLLWTHFEVVILSISFVVLPISQLNTQFLTFEEGHQVNIVVTCIRQLNVTVLRSNINSSFVIFAAIYICELADVVPKGVCKLLSFFTIIFAVSLHDVASAYTKCYRNGNIHSKVMTSYPFLKL